MFRRKFVRLRLGRRNPNGKPISTDNYVRIQPAPLSYVSTHIPSNFGTNLQLSSASTCPRSSVTICEYGRGCQSLAWKMAHQHPSGAICALNVNQPYWDERCSQSSAPEVAKIPSPVQSDFEFDLSHDCQGQECCIYEPAVPTATSYNDYPTPVAHSTHPLSLPQSFELQQHIPTSSHFPNNDDEVFPVWYQDAPTIPAIETFSPPGTPVVLGVALSPTFRENEIDIQNAVANMPIVSNLGEDQGEDWCSPTGWMRATPNTAQSLGMDRYSRSSHAALTLYCDSQNITSDVLYMSQNSRSFSPQPNSSPNHSPTSPPSPENLFSIRASDSSHRVQEGASAELSPTHIWVSAEMSPVLPALTQNEFVKVAVFVKENRCPLCGISFTQSQVLSRHMKDKHEDKQSCAHCSTFKWSRGRPHLYRRHLRVKHSGLASSIDLPQGTRKTQGLRARQCKVLNKKTRFSREPPFPYAGDPFEDLRAQRYAPEILSPQL